MNLDCAHCGRPLAEDDQLVTVYSDELMYLFCSKNCRALHGTHKLTHRVCAKEACNNRVPSENRLLCLNCYERGDNFAEPDTSFDEAETAHWERAEKSLLKRITEQVRVFRAEDMSQEELRALVPSLENEAE